MQRYPIRYALFLIAYYVANSVYQGFITVYFSQIGLSTAQIGFLMSSVPVASMVFQPIWGSVGDRSKGRARVLRVLIAGAAVLVWSFQFFHTFYPLLAALCVFSAFFSSIQPISDSVVLEDLGKKRMRFGPLRMAGSISFAISSLIAGRLLEGRTQAVPVSTACILAVAYLTTYCLPNLPGHQTKNEKTSMLEIFRLPNVPSLMALIVLLQMSMGFFYSFYPVYFSRLPGGTTTLLGLSYLISALSEIPFLFFFDRLQAGLGVGRLLCLSAAAMTARWLILGVTSNVYVVLASQVLHGWGFIVMTVSMAKYLSDHVPEALRARAQVLLSIVGIGLARIAGNLGGGLVGQAIGIQNGFFVAAGITVLAQALYVPKFFRMKPLS